MPIYEYQCNKCNESFEKLVFGSTEIQCPGCSSKDVRKKMSAFGMSGVNKPFAGSSGCNSSACSKGSCSSCK